MNDLIGALSNDLSRVASSYGRDSEKSGKRFFDEAKRWAIQLQDMNTPPHIRKIVLSVINTNTTDLSKAYAEDCLMYSVLLQNYALHAF